MEVEVVEMIRTIIRLKNDMIMVFDADGEQVSKYQGQYKDVRDDVVRDASIDAVFVHWFGYALEPEIVGKEGW